MYNLFDQILDGDKDPQNGDFLGLSREQRPIHGFRIGQGSFTISLIAGCHADEPVGPRFLDQLICYLQDLPASHLLIQSFTWVIVPHANPDGELKNLSWTESADRVFDIARYLVHRIRELPGDDIEFGFPMDEQDDARPENRAIFSYWKHLFPYRNSKKLP